METEKKVLSQNEESEKAFWKEGRMGGRRDKREKERKKERKSKKGTFIFT